MQLLPMRHVPQTCHWSVPTLFMPAPYWLAAWDAPWCCWADRQLLVLGSTAICETCPLWRPREIEAGKVEAVPPRGAMPFRAPEIRS